MRKIDWKHHWAQWKSYRKTRMILLLVALVIDVITWAVIGPLMLQPLDGTYQSSGGIISTALHFLVDSVLIVEMSFICCEIVHVIFQDRSRTLKNLIARRLTLFFLILLCAELVTRLFVLIGWGERMFAAIDVLVYSLISTLVASIYITQIYYDIIIDREKIISDSRLRQMSDTHMVINSLYQLKGLIRVDPDNAELMLDSLSDVTRAITKSTRKAMTSVSEQLHDVQAYVEIMRYRYRDGFNFHIDDSVHELKGTLPSMTLMTAVENVFKHNALLPDEPIEIKIFPKDGKAIVVENTIKKLTSEIPSNKIGIHAVNAAYKPFDLSVTIEHDDKLFRMIAPLITEEYENRNHRG